LGPTYQQVLRSSNSPEAHLPVVTQLPFFPPIPIYSVPVRDTSASPLPPSSLPLRSEPRTRREEKRSPDHRVRPRNLGNIFSCPSILPLEFLNPFLFSVYVIRSNSVRFGRLDSHCFSGLRRLDRSIRFSGIEELGSVVSSIDLVALGRICSRNLGLADWYRLIS
jgi:hypothetical protein